jgi:hypothetical protein
MVIDAATVITGRSPGRRKRAGVSQQHRVGRRLYEGVASPSRGRGPIATDGHRRLTLRTTELATSGIGLRSIAVGLSYLRPSDA